MVVQHPLADLRAFAADNRFRLDRPTWPLASPLKDFIRSSGSVRMRRRGGVSEWEGEEHYCDASLALRFPDGMPQLRLGPAGMPGQCRYSFRRFYSQGTVGRVEVGLRIGVDPTATLGDAWVALLVAWATLPVCIGPRGHRAPQRRLIDAGPALASHYLRATTLRAPTAAAIEPWWLEAGTPALVVEMKPDQAIEVPHARVVRVPASVGRLSHAWLQIGTQRVSAWFLAAGGNDDAAAVRRLRIHLLRLHAEREGLRALMRAVLQRRLDITNSEPLSDAVQHYLNDALRALERPARYGVEQAGMIEVAHDVFDAVFPGETATLSTMRRQVGAKVSGYLQSVRQRATTVSHFHVQGNLMNTSIQLGNVTVTGDFNLVTARNIENSFNKASSAADPALGTALKDLSTQVAQLVKALPPEKAEAAARDLEALTNEATSKAPRKAWYELSAQGLLDAAQAVAALAAPVTTAVGVVLKLLAP